MEGVTSTQPMRWSLLLPLLTQIPQAITVQIEVFLKRLGALVYYIWTERNFRLFEDKALSLTSLANIIASAAL